MKLYDGMIVRTGGHEYRTISRQPDGQWIAVADADEGRVVFGPCHETSLAAAIEDGFYTVVFDTAMADEFFAHQADGHYCGGAHDESFYQECDPYDVATPTMPGGSPVFPPSDAAERKALPVVEGVLDYFPLALLEVAKVSKAGNDQHNPGEPLHWARGKSYDHANTIGRHLLERGTVDTDGLRHSAKLAWRALALLQKELELAQGYDRDAVDPVAKAPCACTDCACK
jgi:hypothetical protein